MQVYFNDRFSHLSKMVLERARGRVWVCGRGCPPPTGSDSVRAFCILMLFCLSNGAIWCKTKILCVFFLFSTFSPKSSNILEKIPEICQFPKLSRKIPKIPEFREKTGNTVLQWSRAEARPLARPGWRAGSGTTGVHCYVCILSINHSTVHAGELGPRGKLSPDNNWLNKIGFFLLLQ